MGNINFDVDILSELSNEITSLFAFFKRIGTAISVTYSYIDQLPIYFKATCFLIVALAVIYLITGR